MEPRAACTVYGVNLSLQEVEGEQRSLTSFIAEHFQEYPDKWNVLCAQLEEYKQPLKYGAWSSM